MLAFVEVVSALASLVVVHEYELAMDGIFEVRLVHQGVGAEHDLVVLREVHALVKVIAHYHLKVILFEHHVVL